MVYNFFKNYFSYKLRKIKSVKTSYSQTGLDLILEKIFNDKKNGFYIDVGCNHPVYNNNTYKFYRRGWRGINIDTDFESIKLFNYFRNRDININTAISSKDTTLKYYFFHDKSPINTLDESTASLHSKKPSEIRNIGTTTLNKILENSNYSNKKIDFLCIDVEGHELEVMKGLDLNIYRPKVIIIEFLDKSIKKIEIKNLNIKNVLTSDLYNYMLNKNYSLVNWLHSDLVFIDNHFRD